MFLVFINDFDENILPRLKKFADDTKLYREISNNNGCQTLQKDLDKLVGWSEEWKMLFNTDKCSVMHLGRSNDKRIYNINSSSIKSIVLEKILGACKCLQIEYWD